MLLALHGAYALGVSPWFEPPPIERPVQPNGVAFTAPAPAPHNSSDELARLFPPDHWVHKNPKIVKTPQCTLLIQDYKPLPDGQLELAPCVLIFYAGGKDTGATAASEPAARGRPIILESPSAKLTFDRAVDFARS